MPTLRAPTGETMQVDDPALVQHYLAQGATLAESSPPSAGGFNPIHSGSSTTSRAPQDLGNRFMLARMGGIGGMGGIAEDPALNVALSPADRQEALNHALGVNANLVGGEIGGGGVMAAFKSPVIRAILGGMMEGVPVIGGGIKAGRAAIQARRAAEAAASASESVPGFEPAVTAARQEQMAAWRSGKAASAAGGGRASLKHATAEEMNATAAKGAPAKAPTKIAHAEDSAGPGWEGAHVYGAAAKGERGALKKFSGAGVDDVERSYGPRSAQARAARHADAPNSGKLLPPLPTAAEAKILLAERRAREAARIGAEEMVGPPTKRIRKAIPKPKAPKVIDHAAVREEVRAADGTKALQASSKPELARRATARAAAVKRLTPPAKPSSMDDLLNQSVMLEEEMTRMGIDPFTKSQLRMAFRQGGR